jgi:hypothetical protein
MFFNIEISGLPDRSLMEIEENVNPGMERRPALKLCNCPKKAAPSQQPCIQHLKSTASEKTP